MVDPWDKIDLTMTCDSDGEASLAPDGEPVNICRVPVAEELRRSPAKILPSLAQGFTEIYSTECSNSHQRSCGQEGVSSLCPNAGSQSARTPGDPNSDLRVASAFAVISSNNDLPEAKRTQLRPAIDFDVREKTQKPLSNYIMCGVRCEEVIEIDDDSNDQIADDAPDFVVVKNENRCSTVNIEDVGRITGADHWEEVDIKYHYGELHTKPPAVNLTSTAFPEKVPEPHVTSRVSRVPSTEPPLANEPLVDIRRTENIDGSTVPRYDGLTVDRHPENETESTMIINSENESNYVVVQSPQTMYYCIYCEYSTEVEECSMKHIAGHSTGTKPYLRMYCTECSYSTGSEKFFLFHMSKTHRIMNPKFYRSGEKRFTCRICKLTQELRSNVESHIYVRHRSHEITLQNNISLMSNFVEGNEPMKMIFQCIEKGCALTMKDLRLLRSHVKKRHNIAPLSYYAFVPQKGKPSKCAMYGCFKCGFKGSDKEKARLHAQTHYSHTELPYAKDVTSTVTVDQSEKVAGKERNREYQYRVISPGRHVTSPVHHESAKTRGNSSDPVLSPVIHIASPEPDSKTAVLHPTSPGLNFIDDEPLIDMPEHDGGSPLPPYDNYAEEEVVENDNDSDDSDFNSENPLGQSPRTFYCIYCEYTTVIEEWYHKHIASHLPGTKPYFRMYCTECSYSTGSEKYLLFHMSQTHRLVNPEFYRSGEKRYTCRMCKHTVELRIDIESHIKTKHKSEKQTLAKNKKDLHVVFQCGEDECDSYYKHLKNLRSHVQKRHNIRFPLYYYRRFQKTAELRLECFSCNRTLIDKKFGNCHAKVHYSSKQRRAPYLYYCPLVLEKSECPVSCKKKSEIAEHYQSVHFKDLKYYKKRECTYECLNCPYIASGVGQINNHCAVNCKNR